jgi:hypothetical protein
MKVEWKIDLTPIVVALILSVAAVSVAKIVAPKRYAPIGAAPFVDSRGFYLDTETGRASFGP